ncbi:MAG: TCP-1/cpn60 chaperonin family protein [Paraclostridium sp.]
MNEKIMLSNIVKKERLRAVQIETLESMKDALINAFGPMGSDTVVYHNKSLTEYTKDGHTILKNIKYMGAIEESVREDMIEITQHIVKTVGDGTTSAVLLSEMIFKELCNAELNIPPYQLIREFKQAVDDIKTEILSNKKEFTPDTAYDITYISTNGNTEVANNIKSIYEKHGNDVFIDVSTSANQDSYLKTYDGMTLDIGYSDLAYINDAKKAICSLRNPEIYMFKDPVDTREMIQYFDYILSTNIRQAYAPGSTVAPIPTIIIAPTISRDLSAYMAELVEFMLNIKDESKRPPLLILTNIHSETKIIDISRMCGCKQIKKYINRDIYEEDLSRGLAPSFETIKEFAGTADVVESDLTNTKFINPKRMHNEDGTTSDEFNTLLSFLEGELARAYSNKEDNNVTGNLKRRINSLKSNMVEYLIGGVSVPDRDRLRHLVEDAVLNCRSAAINGYGRGANFEAVSASIKLKDKGPVYDIIYKAYNVLLRTLYSTSIQNAEKVVKESIEVGLPYNLRTFEYDDKVVCSIMTDIVILEGISKILTIMYTANQFLTATPIENNYL